MKPHAGIYSIRIGVLLAAVIVALQGCGTTAIRPGQPAMAPASEQSALKALANGEYVLAAREYARLAEEARPPRRQDYELSAVDALIKAGQIQDARTRLDAVDVARLPKAFLARKWMLLALIASHEGNPIRAIRLLDRAGATPGLEPPLYAEIYRVKADTEFVLGNPIAAVNNLITRERYLSDPMVIDRNQLRIWEILGPLSLQELRKQLTLARDPILYGWLELAIAYAKDPRGFGKFAKQWKSEHPKHPVTQTLLQTLVSPAPRYVGRVDRIALLLPMSSKYSLAAAAVRDGFMAMHELDDRPDKPTVRLYDVGEDYKEIKQYYTMAVRDGAQLVVGPLGREAVDYLVRKVDLDVPTLLLSHTEENTDNAPAAVFQFGLPPEQEAMQAAERAYLDGHRQAAVLYPEKPGKPDDPQSQWGQRMYKAFAEHWQRLGGVILTGQPYDPDQEDFSKPIKDMLNITNSEARRYELQSLLKTHLSFEPRRRADIDCIFLAANARNGRLLKPQLNYHQAARVPVYATSNIFAGKEDKVYDADLDGVMFGDMPWMLLDDGAIAQLRTYQGAWPYARSQLDRLYALGMDSYAIIPQLNRISSEGAVRFNGVTSGIRINQSGQVQRQLLWAKFRGGVPRVLDNSFHYSGDIRSQSDDAYSRSSRAGT